MRSFLPPSYPAYINRAAVPVSGNSLSFIGNAPNPPSYNHVHPRYVDISFLPELRERVRHHVDSVIRCLPEHETRAYTEAMALDAELVKTETDPIQFVRFCDYDLLARARRLCMYWTERKALFGAERAFLPLTLTGTVFKIMRYGQ